jgi:hypothetical protein
MPDDARGSVQIWRVEDYELVDWPKSRYGIFFQGDSYVILYTYGKLSDKYIIYYWLVSWVQYYMNIILIPYHTTPYHTIPYHTIPYHTIPYHTIPYHTIPYHIPCYAMPYHTMPNNYMQFHTIAYNVKQCNTIEYAKE